MIRFASIAIVGWLYAAVAVRMTPVSVLIALLAEPRRLRRLLGKVETSLELVQTSEEADAKDVY